jgi:D-3-phosphoglycerate dehydrogenase
MVNFDYLSRFSKAIILINAARGEIVSLSDLAECIANGKVNGACLDVLENEKMLSFTKIQRLAFEKLKCSERVIFTPHVAGWTYESYIKINEVLVEKISNLG